MKKQRNNKGFTLIEIIVVLIIIAILAAIAVPAMMKYINDAKEKQRLAEMRSYQIAAQAVVADYVAFDKIREGYDIYFVDGTGWGATIKNGIHGYMILSGSDLQIDILKKAGLYHDGLTSAEISVLTSNSFFCINKDYTVTFTMMIFYDSDAYTSGTVYIYYGDGMYTFSINDDWAQWITFD